LEDLDIEDLLPHCLEIKTKVTKEVHNNAHLGPALFKVFPRTLSLPLAAIWDQLVVNYTNDDHTEANFDDKLREFVASHATDQDRHELVQQLLHLMKPRKEGVSVQHFFYFRLLEPNNFFNWLPSIDDPLTPQQLKHYLYDAMPKTWKDCFVNSGMLFANQTTAEILRYFRQQENQAIHKQMENTAKQQRDTKKKCRPYHNSDKPTEAQPASKKSKKETSDKRQSSRIDDSTPCPIHHGSSHTWGERT
jgi:hypothetical protein